MGKLGPSNFLRHSLMSKSNIIGCVASTSAKDIKTCSNILWLWGKKSTRETCNNILLIGDIVMENPGTKLLRWSPISRVKQQDSICCVQHMLRNDEP